MFVEIYSQLYRVFPKHILLQIQYIVVKIKHGVNKYINKTKKNIYFMIKISIVLLMRLTEKGTKGRMKIMEKLFIVAKMLMITWGVIYHAKILTSIYIYFENFFSLNHNLSSPKLNCPTLRINIIHIIFLLGIKV